MNTQNTKNKKTNTLSLQELQLQKHQQRRHRNLRPSPVPTREEFHRTYGGYILSSDFDSDHYTPPAYYAGRIESAFRFDKQCRQNTETRKMLTENAPLHSYTNLFRK